MSQLILDNKEKIFRSQSFGFTGLSFLTIRYTRALFVLCILLSFCRKRALSGKNFSHHRPAEALFRTVHVNPAGQMEPLLCNQQSQPLGETNSSPHVVGPAGHCRAPWGLIGENLGLLVVWVSKSPTTASIVCELLFQKTGEDSLILDPELQPY